MVKSFFQRFAKRAPVALLFRGLFARVFSPELLNRIFNENRSWQNESALLFSSVVVTVGAFVVKGKTSAHAAFVDHEEEIGVFKQAFYAKRAGIEVPLCEAMVAECTAELSAILAEAKISQTLAPYMNQLKRVALYFADRNFGAGPLIGERSSAAGRIKSVSTQPGKWFTNKKSKFNYLTSRGFGYAAHGQPQNSYSRWGYRTATVDQFANDCQCRKC